VSRTRAQAGGPAGNREGLRITVQEPAWQAAEAAIEALAPEASEFGSLDTAGFSEPILAVLGRAAGRPGDTTAAMLRWWASLARIGPASTLRWLGWDADPPVPVQDYKRFADRAWDAPGYYVHG
jgi:hypothetical protein